MNRFFSRIYLSTWIVVIVTSVLTMFLAGLLPKRSGNDGSSYDEQLVAVVANDLRDALARDPGVAVHTVTDRHVLDFDRLMQIYVLDSSGKDVLGRRLPFAVSRLARQVAAATDAAPQIEDARLKLFRDGLQGYLVVGFQPGYPMGRVLIRPGARTILVVVALIVSAVVALILTRFIVLPVRRLREAGHRVAEGDLSVRVAHTVGGRKDDIADLARDFDTMTDRIEQLLSTQKRLMRDVSHELRSPLSRLQALQSLARQKAQGDELDIVVRMERETERLNQLIGQILDFARLEARDAIDRRNTDLTDLLRAIADDAVVEIGDADKDVVLVGPERCLLLVDNALLHSAFENIIRNAVRFTRDGTNVGVTIVEEGEHVVVQVDDCGPGVPDDALAHMFEPFYQVDEARSARNAGSGVGLAIAQRAVKLHGGVIEAANRLSGGLRVTVRLPRNSS